MYFVSLYIIVGFTWNIYNTLNSSYYLSLPFTLVNMPRRSERAKAIEELENTFAARIVFNTMKMIASRIDSWSSASSSSTFDSGHEGLDNVSTLYNCILSQRYFVEKHHERVDSSRMANDILRINTNGFKARFGMSPTTFDKIWNMIKDHNIFTNVSTSAQFDLRLQFLVFYSGLEPMKTAPSRQMLRHHFICSLALYRSSQNALWLLFYHLKESRMLA